MVTPTPRHAPQFLAALVRPAAPRRARTLIDQQYAPDNRRAQGVRRGVRWFPCRHGVSFLKAPRRELDATPTLAHLLECSFERIDRRRRPGVADGWWPALRSVVVTTATPKLWDKILFAIDLSIGWHELGEASLRWRSGWFGRCPVRRLPLPWAGWLRPVPDQNGNMILMPASEPPPNGPCRYGDIVPSDYEGRPDTTPTWWKPSADVPFRANELRALSDDELDDHRIAGWPSARKALLDELGRWFEVSTFREFSDLAAMPPAAFRAVSAWWEVFCMLPKPKRA